MLILQIALGIVLAVVLLAFLPQIFTLTVWGVIAVVGLALVGVAIYLFSEYTTTFLIIAAIAIAGYYTIKDFTDIGIPSLKNDSFDKKER